MKGTEKQVAWATEIIERIENIFNSDTEFAENEQMQAMNRTMIENMKKAPAWEIIDDFRDVTATDSYQEVCTNIVIRDMTCGRNYRGLK